MKYTTRHKAIKQIAEASANEIEAGVVTNQFDEGLFNVSVRPKTGTMVKFVRHGAYQVEIGLYYRADSPEKEDTIITSGLVNIPNSNSDAIEIQSGVSINEIEICWLVPKLALDKTFEGLMRLADQTEEPEQMEATV